jgi:hypothetical protein
VAILVQQGGYGHVVGAFYAARPDFYPTHYRFHADGRRIEFTS